jgi:AcrR family transcriptional regulator
VTSRRPGKRKQLISLEEKLQPQQSRAQDTYEIVLETAGKMLAEVGFERLTTNRICERAGITPPALYRYFPNKYAVLKTLGERLMTVQDDAVHSWMNSAGAGNDTLESWITRISELQRRIFEVTRDFPGGIAIMRGVRAVPLLQKLHRDSRESIAILMLKILAARHPSVPRARLHMAARVVAEMSSTMTQMALEEPESDTEFLIYETAYLFAVYFRSFRSEPPSNLPYKALKKGTSSRKPATS